MGKTTLGTHNSVFSLLTSTPRMLCICHQKPDGDTLGSAIAIALYRKSINKHVDLFCIDGISQALSFLPCTDNFLAAVPDLSTYDVICIFDCGDLKQTGIAANLENCHVPIINIDHHFTNQHYGTYNCVEYLSSTCELVYRLFEKANVPITSEMATALLTGLVTDTDGFTNPATTHDALHVGAQLLRRGARFKRIMRQLMKNKRVEDLQLWGKVLSNLQTNDQWGCVTTVITLEDLLTYHVDEEATIGIANFLNMLSDTKMALVLRELPDGKVKGSFRTNHNDVDVSKLAKLLGGGGHKKAAGFTIRGKIVKQEDSWRIE